MEVFKMDFALVLKISLPKSQVQSPSWLFPCSPMCFTVHPTSHHCSCTNSSGCFPNPFPSTPVL